jgi:hypothetical protein
MVGALPDFKAKIGAYGSEGDAMGASLSVTDPGDEETKILHPHNKLRNNDVAKKLV